MDNTVICNTAQNIGITKHPRTSDKHMQYGTAGFRTKADTLDSVIYRMGIMAGLRSMSTKATIGVMVTASHNPVEDNGVKLIEPMGEMFIASWEVLATKLANQKDEDLSKCLLQIIEQECIDTSNKASVFIAKDTRPSSEALSQAAIDGATSIGSQVNDYGLLTTPQLHYMVRCRNTQEVYGKATEQGYYDKISKAFRHLQGKSTTNKNYTPNILLDGANGVGGVKWKELGPYLGESISVQVVNDGSSGGTLNHKCGADFVKVQQRLPEGVNGDSPDIQNLRCVSFDGDADRIVYYYTNQEGKFQLLDGDKIATLIAAYLKDLVSATGLDISLGLVQTAYANGSSTAYITDKLKVPVACVPTGIKHLHQKATEFDISVYFEANGHGTALFSEETQQKLRSAINDESLSQDRRNSIQQLSSVIDLINQAVGDAISDLLLVETILHARGWNCEDWNAAYTDLPNRQLKVKVKDRSVIQTTDAERKTTSPGGLQSAIDAVVAKYPQARSFVRPSGTEDVVRIYSEADTRENADALAYEVSVLVYDMAGGAGQLPKQL